MYDTSALPLIILRVQGLNLFLIRLIFPNHTSGNTKFNPTPTVHLTIHQYSSSSEKPPIIDTPAPNETLHLSTCRTKPPKIRTTYMRAKKSTVRAGSAQKPAQTEEEKVAYMLYVCRRW